MGERLRVQLTSFVGRERETIAVHDALDGGRLVTLTGAGGCGKTRLALHVAGARPDAHPDGRWFVDLSLVTDDDAVERAIGEVIEIKPPMTRHLRDRVALVVLDNCEHVIDGVAALVDGLLRSCPGLTVLATSREPLGVADEIVYRVPSLDPGDAVELFVQRAGRSRPGVHADESVVADICDRLDGIPLAIELAAARMRVFTESQIRDGLHDRFRLLTGGARTAVQRQQTLQASVDWSHDLLLDAERAVLRRLSVFPGAFPIEGAEAVAPGGEIERHHVLDLLSQLVDKSLVVAVGERFRLLETVRQYAAARLVEAGESGETWRRLYDWVLALLPRRRDVETDEERRARVSSEYDSIRRALQWSSDLDDATPFVHLCLAMYPYWSSSRRLVDGATWLELAAERAASLDRGTQATVMPSYAHLRFLSGDWAGALEPSEQAVRLAREVGDKRSLMWALMTHASIQSNAASPSSRFIEEALELSIELGDDRARASALFQIGFRHVRDEARADLALQYASESLELARRTGVAPIGRYAAALHGLALAVRGEVRAAVVPLEEVADQLRAAGEGFMLGQILGILAAVRASMGELAKASALVTEVEGLASDSADPSVDVNVLITRIATSLYSAAWDAGLTATLQVDVGAAPSNEGLLRSYEAIHLAMTGRLEEARTIAEDVARRDAVHGFGPPAPAVLGVVALIGGDVEVAEDALLAGVERLATRDVTAGHRLMMLSATAAVFARRQRFDDAARLVGANDAFGESVGVDLERCDTLGFRRDAGAAARGALGDERFEELWREGAQLDRDATVAWLLRGRGRRGRPSSGWPSLTPTERQVVELVAEGLANKEIAARLFVSVPTVKSHLTHVFTKTGLTTRSQLAAAWVRLGDAPAQ